jgi:hypothetical protein
MGSFTICPQLGFIKAAARKQNQRCKDQCGSCHPPNMRPVPFVFRVRKSATIKLTHYQPQVVGQFDCGSRGVESDRFQAHIRGMSEKPKFHTKMVKDGRWTVAFTAGYGPAENIGDFAIALTAMAFTDQAGSLQP